MKLPRPIDAPPVIRVRDARSILLRAGGALLLASVFLWMTSRVDPAGVRARTSGQLGAARENPEHDGSHPAGTTEQLSLGWLEGRERFIRITATPWGARYRVTDRLGNVLADDLSPDATGDIPGFEGLDGFEGVELKTLTAGPVMLVPLD